MAHTYCPNCKKTVAIHKARIVKLKNLRLAVQGACSNCKTTVLWNGEELWPHEDKARLTHTGAHPLR